MERDTSLLVKSPSINQAVKGYYGATKLWSGSKATFLPASRPQVKTLASIAETLSNCATDEERRKVPPCTIFAVAVSSLLPKKTSKDICSCFSILDDSSVRDIHSDWSSSPVTLQIWTMTAEEGEQNIEGFTSIPKIEFGDIIRLQAASTVWFGNQVQVNVSMRIRACSVHVFRRKKGDGKNAVTPIDASGVSLFDLTNDDISRAEQLSDWWRSLFESTLSVRVSPNNGRVVTMRELCADHLPHGIKDHVDIICCVAGFSSDFEIFREKYKDERKSADGFFNGGGVKKYIEAEKLKKITGKANEYYQKGISALKFRSYPDSLFKTSSKELFDANERGVGKDYFMYLWDSSFPDGVYHNHKMVPMVHWPKFSPRSQSSTLGGILVRLKLDAGLPAVADFHPGTWVRLRNVKRANANVVSGRGEPRLFLAEQSGIMKINDPENCFHVKYLLGTDQETKLDPLPPPPPPPPSGTSPKTSIINESERDNLIDDAPLRSNLSSSSAFTSETSPRTSAAALAIATSGLGASLHSPTASTAAILNRAASTVRNLDTAMNATDGRARGSSHTIESKEASGTSQQPRMDQRSDSLGVKVQQERQMGGSIVMNSSRADVGNKSELIDFAIKVQTGQTLKDDDLSRMMIMLQEQREVIKQRVILAEREAMEQEPVFRILTESGSAHDLIDVSKVREVVRYVREMEKNEDLACKVFRVLASVLAVFPADIREGSRSVYPLSKKLKRSSGATITEEDEKSLLFNAELLSELPSHSTHYFQYALRLTDVEPPLIGETAAVIEATLFGRDAETFLPGHTASDLFANDRQFSAIEAKLASLIKADAAGYFCVRVYRSAGGSKKAPVRLRIFDCYLKQDDETF